MRKAKTYSVAEVFNSTIVGFTFEFYCSKESTFITEDLSKISGKNVVITDEEKLQPTYSSSILLKEYDGVRPRYQFKVGIQRYNETPTFLNTMLFWINENASLDATTLLKMNLGYDFKELQTIRSISNMDTGMMVLKIDESFVYERFPEMKGNPSAMSMKWLMPFNMSCGTSNVVNLRNNFYVPIEKHHGIDLTEQTTGNIVFNYIGGPKYSDKAKEVKEVLEYLVITTFQVLNSEEYTSSLVEEFNRLTEEYRKFRKCYFNPKKFFDLYEDFQIFIDLDNNKQLVETQWFQIRDHISKLVLESNIKKCKFNWDTDVGTFQIKDADVKEAYVRGFFIVDSKVSGVLENCHVWSSDIKNSRLINCTLIDDNSVSNSYLQKVRVDRNNKIDESFVSNSGEMINCDCNGTIIKNAGVGEMAKLDENCLVITKKENINVPSSNGIDIKETRDYRWIKTLRREDYKDSGFGNEYKEE